MADFHPDFAPKLDAFRELLRTQYGLDTTIGSGPRTPEEQARLYAQGRTAPGPIVTNAPPGSSYHNYGAATDLVPKNMSEKDAAGVMKQAFADNPNNGLTWGGTFKNLYDPFHVQLGVPLAQLRAGAGAGSADALAAPAVAGGDATGALAAPGGLGGMLANAQKLIAGLGTPAAAGPMPDGTTLDAPTGLLPSMKKPTDTQAKGMMALAQQLMTAGQAPKANFMQLAPANTGPVRPLPLDLPRFGQQPT